MSQQTVTHDDASRLDASPAGSPVGGADGGSATEQPSQERQPYAVATLAFGLAYERAVLEWFAGVGRILPPPREDGSA